MTSTLDEDPLNESWGVRDFQLFLGKCYRGCTACTGGSKADCTTCGLGFELSNGECKEAGKLIIIILSSLENCW